jgi:hypothetical protein
MLLAQYRDGSIRVLTRNQVAEFDLQTLNAKRQLIESGQWTAGEIKDQIRVLSISNRNKANTLEGYSVMNGDPALEYTLESGHVSRDNVRKIYLVTDGMFHFIENDEDPEKWEKFVARLDEYGIALFMDHLVEQEERDHLCLEYPRHKKSDDKSAIILEFP